MEDVYLLILTGQGDTFAKVVDKPTYEWIVSDELGRSHQDKNNSGWLDTSIPDTVKQKLWDKEEFKEEYDNDYSKFGVYITIGSYNNDRALRSPVIEMNNKKALFWSVKEAFDFINKNNLNLIDSFEGYIY